MNAPVPHIGLLRQDPDSGLGYRLREPLAPQPSACVVLLHGVGGNESNLAELATALPPDVLAVVVRGPLPLGPGQYAWFRVNFTGEGPRINPDEAEAARLTLLKFLGHLASAYGVAASRTVIAGFSQGGIMSASVALTAPEQVGGFAILSGRILPELASQIAERPRLASLRAYISHGDADNMLPVSWAERAEEQLRGLSVGFESHRYPAGHTITPAMQADFLRWVQAS